MWLRLADSERVLAIAVKAMVVWEVVRGRVLERALAEEEARAEEKPDFTKATEEADSSRTCAFVRASRDRNAVGGGGVGEEGIRARLKGDGRTRINI